MSTAPQPELLMESVGFDAMLGYRLLHPDGKKGIEDLGPLGRINIFIGENNSGKSRFLRWLARNKLNFSPSAAKLKDLNTLINSARIQTAEILQGGSVNLNSLWETSQNLKPIVSIKEGAKYLDVFSALIAGLSKGTHGGTVSGNWHRGIGEQLGALGESLKLELSRLSLLETYAFPKVYIPTLRTLRKIRGDDVFKELILEEQFRKSNAEEEPPTIFTGLGLYNQYRNLLLGKSKGREWVRAFEEFISETFYSGRKVTIIPHVESGEIGVAGTLIIQIGEQEWPISQVGDGIQATILLTYPLFEQKDKEALFFFDEPEAFLHPGFQRVFLNALRRKDLFPRHQYFLTSHSNHLLDMTADKESISIFTFKADASTEQTKGLGQTFRIENVANDDMQPLVLLGVRNSSVLLSNCTVWVEGITDRRYLARWLKLYVTAKNTGEKAKAKSEARDIGPLLNEYREDLHFSFVEYSGGNITHWSFLDKESDAIKPERLCAKLFLIADNDHAKPGSEKAKRAEKLKETLGDQFYQLPCREIENLLTPATVSAIVKEIEGQEISFSGIKSERWDSEGMGTLIQETVTSAAIGSKRKYAADSGTVARKVAFCESALKHMNTFSDLSVGAQELTEKVYVFIKGNNA